jgi:hypothetical protein
VCVCVDECELRVEWLDCCVRVFTLHPTYLHLFSKQEKTNHQQPLFLKWANSDEKLLIDCFSSIFFFPFINNKDAIFKNDNLFLICVYFVLWLGFCSDTFFFLPCKNIVLFRNFYSTTLLLLLLVISLRKLCVCTYKITFTYLLF